ERGVLIELYVRADADLGPQSFDGTVRLVPLDHEPALPRAGVAVELSDLAADEPRRIEAELGEHEGDHPPRSTRPVRACDDDRAPEGNELGEELGAPRAGHRRVGARDDGLPPVRHDGLRRNPDVDPVQPTQIRRLDPVPAADLRSPRTSKERV